MSKKNNKKREMGKMLKDVMAHNKAELLHIAQKNTKTNEDGFTVIEKNDPWRDDEDDHLSNISLTQLSGVKIYV